MSLKRKFKRFVSILKHTGMIQMLSSFLICLSIAAFLLFLWEPGIKTIGDGFWYCFVASTTIGFGDICVTTVLGKIITVLLSVYGILTASMIPGVVVTYYTESLKARESETITAFMEKLERLPELSKEELEEMSQRVKKLKEGK